MSDVRRRATGADPRRVQPLPAGPDDLGGDGRRASPPTPSTPPAAETREKFQTDRLAWTIPFVLYGIFRYLYLVHRKEQGGSPTDILLTDRPLLVDVALWALTVVADRVHGQGRARCPLGR